ncbi:MAG: AmmeMemoRadiSam system protein B [Bacteroidales bacterium]|nr:AmmeMemoRadiSam system protein B [Bacteroidales bacterium]MCI2122082.1 AmmeMemoRadiSam system protein B [Bacteroidales bacterium]MCI2146321.1 AmmeMemoRadiSam system protein B [Bacteroidales bacterium]
MSLCAMSSLGQCDGQTAEEGKVRRPAAAGSFYPASRKETMEMLSECFAPFEGKECSENAVAVIVPHAGYVFSGMVAAAAFSKIDPDRKFEHIFLIGPSHYVYMDGASVNTGYGYYRTPLGDVMVDTALGKKLVAEHGCFKCNPAAHDREHCLEVQLPFLQHRLKSMPPIVPVIVGCQDADVIREVAEALKPYFNGDNLFVISSDFSHYPSYEDAEKVDGLTGKAVGSGSILEFVGALKENAESGVANLATSACGQSAIAVLMFMTGGDGSYHYEHLMYRNSGDTEYGDKDRVVGYHAFVITRDDATGKKSTAGVSDFALDAGERKTLLGIARKAIANSLEGSSKTGYDDTGLSPALKEKCGAFVTLNEGGNLRGCIGHFGNDMPLYMVIDEMARAAAFEDPRFSPVDASETDSIEIEISVLTPMKKISSADEFTLGKQGIYIEKNGRSGTFLPQVAEETGWSKEEFLGHCARDKAGLGWNDWKSANLYTYEALVFKEGDYK